MKDTELRQADVQIAAGFPLAVITAGVAALPDWVEDEADRRGESLTTLVARVYADMSRQAEATDSRRAT